MKKTLIIIILNFFIFLASSCVTYSISIDGERKVEVGCSIDLDVEYDGPYNIEWETSNDKIATVINGKVIAKKEGEVTITAKAGTVKTSINITVIPLVYTITIIGTPSMKVGETYKFKYETSKDVSFDVIWSSTNTNVIDVDSEGNVQAKSKGEASIVVLIGEVRETYNVVVTEEKVFNINVTSPSSIESGKSFTLEPTINENEDVTFMYKSLNETIAVVDSNGVVTGIKSGTANIEIYLLEHPKSKVTITITITDNIPNEIILSGKTNITMGEHSNISVEFIGNGSKEIVWSSSNTSVASIYHGIILGLQCGTTTITAKSILDDKIYGTIEIIVNEFINDEVDKEKMNRVNNIINNMTLSQKIGQMFVVGFNGTTMSSTLSNAISNYNFGNVIYMAYNVSSPSTLTSMSNKIQTKMVESNSVPAFISTDQEGGRVARLTNGGTHFISQMAMAATNNPHDAYLEGAAVGKELRSYGINLDFAPVLDVNNNPDNPIIGIRSYSDNPLLASLYGNNFINGLHEEGVLACPKHFPGHGNTAVDSHYGLPVITSSMDELYQVELAPFISAIQNGVDTIMTTHIIFNAIDTVYPATLSEKVLTGLLRNTLHYNGVIVTDGMGMDAIDKYFGSPDITSVLAVKAGVDILTYTSINEPIIAHKALMNSVKTGEIDEERINESVRRILLAKLEKGILDNFITSDMDRSKMLEEHESLNIGFAKNSITQLKGEFYGLNKNKSTLIISPTTTYNLGTNLASNSFGCYAANYLKMQGHTNVDYKNVDKNISSNDSSSIINAINNYDQIVVAFSNVKTSNYTRTVSFVNTILSKHNNVIVIALDTPYDALTYNNINNYICVYGYQKATVVALTQYLNGEFTAKGKSPIDENIFE